VRAKRDADASPAPLGSRVQRGASLARLSTSTGAGYLSSRLRGLVDDDADERFHLATAERMLELLGSMKGAAMKLGQLASFVDLDLPPEAAETYRAVLAELRSAAPPVDPATIRQVVHEQFGAPPEQVFARWDADPLAAASIGQVHRACLPDGTEVAVKVQYPGIAEAIESDLANAELFTPFARLFSPNLEIKPLVAELRDRLVEELDYQREAAYQQAFADRYDGHPFIRVPRVFADWSRPRVLTSEFVAGRGFEAMLASSTPEQRRRYGEILYRFVFGSLHRFRLFNADPHPGNYLFPDDGSVVFLDFGSVKMFPSKTRDDIQRQVASVVAGDVDEMMAAMTDAGFVPPGANPDPAKLLEWFRLYNTPLLADGEWTYTPEFAREINRTTSDPRMGYFDLLRRLNLPPDYLTLNRIQIGVNSILAQLGARGNWWRILRELWGVDGPATELGEAEAEFIQASPYRA